MNEQAERLIGLGVHELLGQSEEQVRAVAAAQADGGGGLLVPASVPCSYSDLMALVTHDGKPGFVVEDFTDAAEFAVTGGANSDSILLPGGDWYTVHDPQRGDEFANASPAEALEAISAVGRMPLTMIEGIFWLYQRPELLERNRCFMTIGSRKPKARGGFDARTPALWISNGTGRDGAAHRNAPKLGWCWWNNRHTWLGIAHAAARTAI